MECVAGRLFLGLEEGGCLDGCVGVGVVYRLRYLVEYGVIISYLCSRQPILDITFVEIFILHNISIAILDFDTRIFLPRRSLLTATKARRQRRARWITNTHPLFSREITSRFGINIKL